MVKKHKPIRRSLSEVLDDELDNDLEEDDDDDEETTGTVIQGAADADPVATIRPKKKDDDAIDLLDLSIERQVTQLGIATAEKLRKSTKDKVMVPVDKMNKEDQFVLVGINGWNFQIQRGVPVILPEEVIDLLLEGGYNPTRVK